MRSYKYSRYNHIIEYGQEYLIYNSVSGALSVMSDDEKKQMEELVIADMDTISHEEKIFLDHLLLNNYLIPKEVDELAVLKEKYDMRKQRTDRIVLTILPTLGCNFACNYCFEGNEKSNQVMGIDIQNRWLQWLEEHMKGVRHLSVTWFGGEPTLAMAVIRRMSDRMMSLCQQHQISYTAGIITNGYMLSEELVGELYVRGVRMIQVTLDGPSYIHDKVRYVKGSNQGSFHKILKNICDYSKLYPAIHTSIRINVDERNELQCFELLDELKGLLKNAKNTTIYFAPIHASTSMCEHISQFTLEAMHYAELETKLMKKALEYGLTQIGLPPVYMGLCGAANPNGYVALPDGSIHKCWETVSMKEYQVGTILEEPIVEEEKFKKWLAWSPFHEEECKECGILPNCAGMCTYRFRYKENYSGNSALSPCPSLKYELGQRLLMFMKEREKNCQ